MAQSEHYDPQCCACIQACCHVGAHSYCEKHKPKLHAAHTSIHPEPWECPRCHGIMAPHQYSCTNCGPEVA